MKVFFAFAVFAAAWYMVAIRMAAFGAGGFRRHLLGFCGGFIGLLVYVVIFTGRSSGTQPQHQFEEVASTKQTSSLPAKIEEPEGVVKVNAAKLFDAYQANELAADQKYKGRMLLVTGVVQSVKIRPPVSLSNCEHRTTICRRLPI